MGNKTLHIARHGKSSWKYENVLDIDRPLKNKGIGNTYLMAEKIKGKIKPDLIISSPANRAIHTATIFARMLNYSMDKVDLNKILYNHHEEVILNFISKSDDQINSLFIVGHNPEFTNLANYFLKKTIDKIPTSGIVSIVFDINKWTEISKEKVISFSFYHPQKSD